MRTISVSLDQATIDKLDSISVSQHRSRELVLADLVTAYVERQSGSEPAADTENEPPQPGYKVSGQTTLADALAGRIGFIKGISRAPDGRAYSEIEPYKEGFGLKKRGGDS